jgi:hypothetical protein
VVDADNPGEPRPDDSPGESTYDSIEGLAAVWLESERTAVAVGNANNTEERARVASAAYDAAVAGATPEELLLAWQAAQATAGRAEMGSKAWAEAREVAELLRVEYLARGPDRRCGALCASALYRGGLRGQAIVESALGSDLLEVDRPDPACSAAFGPDQSRWDDPAGERLDDRGLAVVETRSDDSDPVADGECSAAGSGGQIDGDDTRPDVDGLDGRRWGLLVTGSRIRDLSFSHVGLWSLSSAVGGRDGDGHRSRPPERGASFGGRGSWPGRGGRGCVPGAISAGRSRGGRSRAAFTDAANAWAVAVGRLRSHAPSISRTRSVSWARRSRSRFECFAIRSSLRSRPQRAPIAPSVALPPNHSRQP